MQFFVSLSKFVFSFLCLQGQCRISSDPTGETQAFLGGVRDVTLGSQQVPNFLIFREFIGFSSLCPHMIHKDPLFSHAIHGVRRKRQKESQRRYITMTSDSCSFYFLFSLGPKRQKG